MVSVLAAQHFEFGDVLKDVEMRPWWETFRSRCTTVSVVSSLLVMYISIQSSATRCLPDEPLTNTTYDTTGANFVDSYCANQMDWQITLAGLLTVLSVLMFILISDSWLFHPRAINLFRNMKNVREMVINLHMTPLEIKDLFLLELSTIDKPTQTEPRPSNLDWAEKKQKDDEETFRKASKLIRHLGSSLNLKALYFKRTFILLLVTLALLAINIIYVVYLTRDNQHFLCSLDSSDFIELEPYIGEHQKFFCSYTLARKFAPIYMLLAVTFILKLIFCCIGLWKVQANITDFEFWKPIEELLRKPIFEKLVSLASSNVIIVNQIAFIFLLLFGCLGMTLYIVIQLLIFLGKDVLCGYTCCTNKQKDDNEKKKILTSNLLFMKIFWESSRPVGFGCLDVLLGLATLDQAVYLDDEKFVKKYLTLEDGKKNIMRLVLKAMGTQKPEDLAKIIMCCINSDRDFIKQIFETYKPQIENKNQRLWNETQRIILEKAVFDKDKVLLTTYVQHMTKDATLQSIGEIAEENEIKKAGIEWARKICTNIDPATISIRPQSSTANSTNLFRDCCQKAEYERI